MAEGQTESSGLLSRVFVYGTLMPGQRNEPVARRGGQYETERAALAGFALYDLHPERYPVIVPGAPDQVVHGWLYAYADWPRAARALDPLEGTEMNPPLYHRVVVRVTTAAGRELDAWVYVYARRARLDRSGASLLPDGVYRG